MMMEAHQVLECLKEPLKNKTFCLYVEKGAFAPFFIAQKVKKYFSKSLAPLYCQWIRGMIVVPNSKTVV